MASSMDNPDDKYKIFDTSEFQANRIISFDGTGVVLLQRRVSYATAAGLLAVGVGCLLAVVFLLLFSVSSVRTGQLQAQVQELKQAKEQTCRSEGCLRQAAYLMRIMNHSADPCDDFYKYACGNYDKVLPDDHFFSATTVFHEMDKKAQSDIEAALVKRTSDDWPVWEQKVKMYYYICQKYYKTYIHKDNPFVTKVLNRTDHGGLGSYLLGRSTKDLNVDLMFRTVSGKYYVPSLFFAKSSWSDYLHKRNSDRRYDIWIGRTAGAVGIVRYRFYAYEHLEVYKRFIKDIANLLIRDSNINVPNKDQIVETFADDVLYMEKKLYSMHMGAWGDEFQMFKTDDPTHPDKMIRVGDLTSRMSSFINFKEYLRQIYGQDEINDDTRVVFFSTTYLDKLNTLFTQMNKNSSDEFKRKVGNYLTWVVTSFFEWDLSPEYRLKFKAIRQVGWFTYNPEENSHTFCFATARWGMNQALSALYVKEYLEDASRDKANKLFNQLKEATKAGIDRLSWMDADTKDKAKKKVDSIVEKSGYPDEAKDDSYLNNEFSQIPNSQKTEYFDLLIASIDYRKRRQGKLLGKYNALDFEHWGQLWDTHFSYHVYDNEILMQAGILQMPLFSKDLPQQLVYGGFGTLIAHEIIQSFDIEGQQYFQSTGFTKDGWWSQSTIKKYNEKATCLTNSIKGMVEYYEQGRLDDLPRNERKEKIDSMVAKNANWTVREIAGLHNARSAFDLHKMDDPMHVRLPVYDNTEDQMFYISYAQMNCHHLGYFFDMVAWQKNWFPWKILVNTVVAQVPSFAKTFNCKANSKLNPKDRCDIY